VSSWSKKADEGSTAPAWNIHQYGYMGGASQGNQGISFGARRQIVSQSPQVPSLAEKEKKRKEQEAEAERLRVLAEEAEHKRRVEREAEEERERMEEEQRWEEESKKEKETARQELEEQKRRWAAEERQWQEAEEQRLREERASEEARRGAYSGLGLRNPALDAAAKESPRRVSESERIRELERQLEEAKERERQYQLERQARGGQEQPKSPTMSPQKALPVKPVKPVKIEKPSSPVPEVEPVEPVVQAERSSPTEERDLLLEQWTKTQDVSPIAAAQPFLKRPLPVPRKSSATVTASLSRSVETSQTGTPAPTPITPTPAERSTPQPLPNTSDFSSSASTSRPTRLGATPSFARYSPAQPSQAVLTPERFTALAPATPPPGPRFAQEISMGSTSERAVEDARRVASQARTKAGGMANKSLLEREMERERERQKEWEEAQMAKRSMSTTGGSPSKGGLIGPREMKR